MALWSYITLSDYLIALAIIILIYYLYLTWNFDFFKKRNIPHKKPSPIVGNMGAVLGKKQAFADYLQETYNAFPDEKVIGVFRMSSPEYMITDPELIKLVTVKEFDHFMDRSMVLPEDVDPLFNANLAALRGQKWRRMRNILSPAFTSSKMRGMFPLVSDCGKQLVEYLEEHVKRADNGVLEMDMKELFSKFTNDVIATSAFGIKCDSLKNPENDFYLCGKDITTFTGLKSLKLMCFILVPKLMSLLKINFFSKKSSDFLYNTVRETIRLREEKGIVRPDMIHLLMQARKGELDDEDEDKEENTNQGVKQKGVKHDLSDMDIAGQAMIFFIAGFDTTSTMLGFASLLLALHPDIQERLKEEIDQTLESCGGEITYEALHNMKYLDMVVSETLRLYPTAVATDRRCSKPFTIPATENTPAINIGLDEKLILPFFPIHRDPQYFPYPDRFDPERFSEENRHKIKPFTYMPFGMGPRSCIGNRFGLMEDKIALVYLLSRFTLQVIDKTPIPIRLQTKSFAMAPEGGFWVGISDRRNSGAS